MTIATAETKTLSMDPPRVAQPTICRCGKEPGAIGHLNATLGLAAAWARLQVIAGLSPEVLFDHLTKQREDTMPESVYKVIELVGTSTESWEKAAKAAVDRAAKSLRDLRI